MRKPRVLDDRDLLDDEPFRSEFLAYHLGSSTSRRGSICEANHIYTVIARAVREQPGGEAAAQAWLDIAFAASPKERDEVKNMRMTVNDATLEIFVHFFWLLFLKMDAHIFLKDQRREKGFVYAYRRPRRGVQFAGETSAAAGHANGHDNLRNGMDTSVPTIKDPSAVLQPQNTLTGMPASSLSSPGTGEPKIMNKDVFPKLENAHITEEPSNWIASGDGEDEMSDGADDGESFVGMVENTNVLPQFKPPLQRNPPIWAQSRQEICESFDWFRSYHSGVYHANNIVKGYLLSAFASSRDRFEHGGKLIISHGGGKSESLHSNKGHIEKQSANDQLARDKSVRALLNNYRECRPLVLLIDDKYALFPYDLCAGDITYAVLGFFVIVHAWAEYQPASNERGRVVRYKFAFQWCEGQGEPWWIPKNDEMAADPPTDPAVDLSPVTTVSTERYIPKKCKSFSNSRPKKSIKLYFQCSKCGEQTPRVYQQGWACLNPDCAGFWTMPNGDPMPDQQLVYYPSFLKLSPSKPLPLGFRDLRPPPPVSLSSNGVTTTYAFSRGWHCARCGRLSSRFKWEHWECSQCGSVFRVAGRIREAKELRALTVPVSFFDHYIAPGSGIVKLPATTFGHKGGVGNYQSFTLPNQRGWIHHIQGGCPSANREADIIFQEYQDQASDGRLVFRRWPLRSHKVRGPLLTNYFSQNSGEPYQYVGGTENTVPWNESPGAVVKARDLIQDRIYQALKKPSFFNEVLSAAYMERQKMAFHSDSELGLGPVVAGLSLGSPALMHFRLHAKHDPNKEKSRIALTFVLRHGDVLVMEGNQVQDYYEHTVIPANFRIAATARHIAPVHL